MEDDYPYVTTAEAAARIGISTVRMTQLCRRGQVSGALRFGRAWMVPADFEWERHNTGPKPKRDALNSKLSRVSAKRAGSSTAASESAAALITTTESFGPGCPVLDGRRIKRPNLLAAGSTVYQSHRASCLYLADTAALGHCGIARQR